ncbi:zinc ABC transporter substrate-binding protein [candidate division KSB1 bacterium]|nr:zinc ABC transporter substrate-binding protein [candidate division KSB1 bacterium]
MVINFKKYLFSYILIFFTLINLISCEKNTKGKLSVFVSILPQKYFAERIGGYLVNVSVLVGPGQNPHAYEPLPQQMLAFSSAQIYFRIGVSFEDSWIHRIEANNPKLKIVDTRQGIQLVPLDSFEDITLPADTAEAHHDADESYQHAEHEHQGLDPHIWLSPDLVKIQVETICETLCQFDSVNAPFYQENLYQFHKELDALSQEIQQVFTDMPSKKILVFHPAWGYFTRQFGLQQIPIEIEGKSPGPKQLAAIIDFARKERISIIFVQSQLSTQSAAAIGNELKAQVVTIDPLGENYLTNLKQIATTIAKNVQSTGN